MDRVQDWKDAIDRASNVGVDNSVKVENVFSVALPVYCRLVELSVRDGRNPCVSSANTRPLSGGDRRNSRSQDQQLRKIATVQGKLLHGTYGNDGAEFRAGSLQQRTLGCDSDTLGGCTHLHADILRQGLIHLNFESADIGFPETSFLDIQNIGAWQYIDEQEIPVRVCLACTGISCSCVGQPHPCTADGRPRTVCHSSVHLSIRRLCTNRQGKGEQNDDEQC